MSPSHSAVSRRHLTRLDGGFLIVITSDQIDRIIVEWCFTQRSWFCFNGFCYYQTPLSTLILVAFDRLAHLLTAVFAACAFFAWRDVYQGNIKCTVGSGYTSPVVLVVEFSLFVRSTDVDYAGTFTSRFSFVSCFIDSGCMRRQCFFLAFACHLVP